MGKKKKEQAREEAWVRGKWMRQEETRECEEVGGCKQTSRNRGVKERGKVTAEERK